MQTFLNIISNQNILLYFLTYIFAAIPFGYIITKFFLKINIRQEGSGSIGTTNVLRVLKIKFPELAKKLAITTFILDAVKGVIFILIGKYLGVSEDVLWGIAVISVVGHCFSPFLLFEGGKGVATGFGVVLIMLPIEAIIAITIWYLAGKVFKISSLASLTGVGAMLISSYIIHSEIPIIISHSPLWIITIIIFYKHSPNIIRMITREEKGVFK